MNAIARLKGRDAIAYLSRFLSDPKLHSYALIALAEIVEAEGDDNLVPHLTKVGEDPGSRARYRVALAAAGTGGDRGRALALKVFPRLSPHGKMLVWWRLNSWTLTDVLDHFEAAGFPKRPEREDLIAAVKARYGPWVESPTDVAIVNVALAESGWVYRFGLEMDVLPPEYPVRIEALAKLTGGLIEVDCASESYYQADRREDSYYSIQFFDQDTHYRFRVRDSPGGWAGYDVESVIAVLHRIIGTKTETKRFFSIEDTPNATYIFGDKVMVANVMRDLLIPPGRDAREMTEETKEWERQVIERLRRQYSFEAPRQLLKENRQS